MNLVIICRDIPSNVELDDLQLFLKTSGIRATVIVDDTAPDFMQSQRGLENFGLIVSDSGDSVTKAIEQLHKPLGEAVKTSAFLDQGIRRPYHQRLGLFNEGVVGRALSLAISSIPHDLYVISEAPKVEIPDMVELMNKLKFSFRYHEYEHADTDLYPSVPYQAGKPAKPPRVQAPRKLSSHAHSAHLRSRGNRHM